MPIVPSSIEYMSSSLRFLIESGLGGFLVDDRVALEGL